MTDQPDNGGAPTQSLFAEGRNCWRIADAGRLAYLVDAAAYFRAFKAAALKARQSILIIGWDVNSRAKLEYSAEARRDVPNELGPFLDFLAREREGLHIHVLDWDSPLLYAPDREWMPQIQFDWFTHPRLTFALDSQHPLGAAHHQKIVVIDDRVAFVGGLDLTAGRLDSPEHKPEDPRRHHPDGTPYEPFHDVQIVVEGQVAHALGEVARERWRRATGETLEPAAETDDGAESEEESRWPERLDPDLENVQVAVSRTFPAWRGHEEVCEIKALLLDAIACAKRRLYIENQYLTASSIARALMARLEEADGPEIVVVVPQEPTGWLEQSTMGLAQRCALATLRNADQHGRFRVYMPMVGESGDVGVKIHSKVMIVDDRLLIGGSANLNNRSMGLDTECNVAVEGEAGSQEAASIAGLQSRLLSEHLDVSPERFAEELEARGSLVDTVEALRGEGRSLKPFPEVPPDKMDKLIADSEFLDPDAPAEPERIADELAASEDRRTGLRNAFGRLAAVIVVLVGFAVFWRWGPLSSYLELAQLEALAQSVRSDWEATLFVIAAYVIGGLTLFPVTVLIALTGFIYGPVSGFLVAIAGSLLSAASGYGAGALLGRSTLRRFSGGKLDRINQELARRGLISMAIVRMLPVAPFTLINLAAGASRIRFRDYVLGTFLGMAPGIAAITVFSSQIGAVIRAPNAWNLSVLVLVVLAIAGAALWSWRRFVWRRRGTKDE